MVGGPSLLKMEDSVWPEATLDLLKENFVDLKGSESLHENLLSEGVDLEERKVDKGSVSMISSVEMVGVGNVIDIKRFGDLEKLLRVTVYVVRFVNNLKASVRKSEVRKGEIVVDELIECEKLWVKYEQTLLKTESKFKKLENSLALFYD